ncbi:MAG: S-adenosylmethionine:tRNA ribosyltransferase-isomerase [Bacteroidaceae bacterium]|nr:S-adenosylmethionine:tRNA ribosyltransferase-isomerase [Bacteroidaceae bacterium]
MTQDIEIKDYNYDLPDERIAKFPLTERDASKMLVYTDDIISDAVFSDIAEYIPKGELMVFNNTRVIRARLHFHKETGALIEIFCLEPEQPRDYAMMFQAHSGCVWQCMVGNLKKWKEGTLTQVLADGTSLTAERIGECGNSWLIRFSWTGEKDFAHVLEEAGELPIPPYLNRNTEESDLTTYQTVYCKIKGSVAAPTAGLHFTDRVLQYLDAKGIERDEVTLHVGAGTFKPVKADHIGGHEMHSEHIVVSRATIDCLIAHGGHCTAVGTTSVRTLESLYYIGLMVHEGLLADEENIVVPQWIPYESHTTLTTCEALQAVADMMTKRGMTHLKAATKIIIAPGYEYHIVHRMVTNFHQPQSTLLLLVSAFLGGERWRDIYRHALATDYRFLSYGDCCLLSNPQ